MKRHNFISYLCFAVFLLAFSHSLIPHGNHTHSFCDIFYQEECGHATTGSHTHQHFPNHSQEQCISIYIVYDNSHVIVPALPAICHSAQFFDIIPPDIELGVPEFIYIPAKIPNQFAEAVPLRAPPIV